MRAAHRPAIPRRPASGTSSTAPRRPDRHRVHRAIPAAPPCRRASANWRCPPRWRRCIAPTEAGVLAAADRRRPAGDLAALAQAGRLSAADRRASTTPVETWPDSVRRSLVAAGGAVDFPAIWSKISPSRRGAHPATFHRHRRCAGAAATTQTTRVGTVMASKELKVGDKAPNFKMPTDGDGARLARGAQGQECRALFLSEGRHLRLHQGGLRLPRQPAGLREGRRRR